MPTFTAFTTLPDKDKAEALVSVMGLPQEAASVLEEPPTKVWEQSVPTDPCI